MQLTDQYIQLSKEEHHYFLFLSNSDFFNLSTITANLDNGSRRRLASQVVKFLNRTLPLFSSNSFLIFYLRMFSNPSMSPLTKLILLMLSAALLIKIQLISKNQSFWRLVNSCLLDFSFQTNAFRGYSSNQKGWTISHFWRDFRCRANHRGTDILWLALKGPTLPQIDQTFTPMRQIYLSVNPGTMVTQVLMEAKNSNSAVVKEVFHIPPNLLYDKTKSNDQINIQIIITSTNFLLDSAHPFLE